MHPALAPYEIAKVSVDIRGDGTGDLKFFVHPLWRGKANLEYFCGKVCTKQQ